MKKLLIAGCAFLSLTVAMAQQKQGFISFERTSKIQISFSDTHGSGMEQQMPKTRTDKFELTFGNNQSLWKAAETDDETNDVRSGDGGGMQIRMVVAGNNDVLYNNFETGKKVEKRELFDKNFIIDDTISKLKWKMTGETKTILNQPCMKATTQTIRSRTMMNMDNGKMERKEIHAQLPEGSARH